ncbi:hypothetical protein QQX98_001325 [Neonectria punicea]|uniref:Amidase domain-containing protein n=1 Tax=Neonectria punicea TaxID=979145 RepID=A0ABR1HQ85_9HYPO
MFVTTSLPLLAIRFFPMTSFCSKLLSRISSSSAADAGALPRLAANGWSARGGQTYGAFAASQSTEGSSSGSAVSMILGLAAVSLGTETYSSIVAPAKKASIVGARTTTGLVPRDGVIPLSDRQDTVGP